MRRPSSSEIHFGRSYDFLKQMLSLTSDLTHGLLTKIISWASFLGRLKMAHFCFEVDLTVLPKGYGDAITRSYVVKI